MGRSPEMRSRRGCGYERGWERQAVAEGDELRDFRKDWRLLARTDAKRKPKCLTGCRWLDQLSRPPEAYQALF